MPPSSMFLLISFVLAPGAGNEKDPTDPQTTAFLAELGRLRDLVKKDNYYSDLLDGLRLEYQLSESDAKRREEIQKRFREIGQERSPINGQIIPTARRVYDLLGRLLDAGVDDPEVLRGGIWSFETGHRPGEPFPLEPARRAVERLLVKAPRDPAARAFQVRMEWAHNHYQKAIDLAAELLKDQPSQRDAQLYQARSFAALNRFEEAERIFADLIVYRPELTFEHENMHAFVKMWDTELQMRARDEKKGDLPRALLETSRGDITLELFEDDAANTVANFISLVEKKFYDGLKFHEVAPNSYIQTGCPNTRDDDPANDGLGGPGYAIPDEGLEDTARMHFRGTVSMALKNWPESGGSQFFICHTPDRYWNFNYTAFGRVISGMEVVDAIQPGDRLIRARILRKREHPYVPVTHKEPEVPKNAPKLPPKRAIR